MTDKQYTFDFDNFTVGHVAALASYNDMVRLWALNDLTVGGIYHLPMTELDAVMKQFHAAYSAFALKVTHYRQVHAGEDDALNDMLSGIEGL